MKKKYKQTKEIQTDKRNEDRRVMLEECTEKKRRRSRKRQITIVLTMIVLAICLMVGGLVYAISSVFHRSSKEEPAIETQAETVHMSAFEEKDITIGSTGSMLLHSPFINSYPDENGNYDFSSIYKYITPYYSTPDFMTCEFEGALGGSEMGYSGYPMFVSPDIIIQNIKDSGVDLQFLASNHIYDGGSMGFHRTMDVYEERKIDYSGIRKNESSLRYYIADIEGVKVGFINYVYETDGLGVNINGIPLNEEDGPLLNTFDYNDLESFYKDIQTEIIHMKQDGAQFIIAQMHWGIEYQLTESSYQDEMAQKLCELGVNAIIGGHPHCEQPIDVYTNASGEPMFTIFSEGNALSNQRTYLMDEMPTGHTEDGVMITLTLHQDSEGAVKLKDVSLLPTWVYRYQDISGSKYFILPLDDAENIETQTGISGIKDEAVASRNRTLEELNPGLEKVKNLLQ